MDKSSNYNGRRIEIITELPCKNRCKYCPQDVMMDKYKGDRHLTLENFKKILGNVPKDVIVTFAGFGEPFQNKECADMILYANDNGYRVAVWTTTVGLSGEDAERLEVVPFVRFNVHDIGQDKKDYKIIQEWHKAIVNGRGGNLYKESRKETVSTCSMGTGFSQNVMFPNGDVVICCSDWSLSTVIGNLLETNYNDLNREWDKELCHYCAYAL